MIIVHEQNVDELGEYVLTQALEIKREKERRYHFANWIRTHPGEARDCRIDSFKIHEKEWVFE